MKVSVIVPYDRDRGYLSQCIESINAQTYQDVELIESHHPRPKGYNFNRGLERATGEFVKWVDEDDWLPTDSIENLVNGMGDHPWICANSFDVGETTEITKSVFTSFEDTLRMNSIHAGTVLFRTELLREIGGMDESLMLAEEFDMYLRLMLNGHFPGYIDKEVSYYRMWEGSKSLQPDQKWRREQISNIRARYETER